MAADRDVLLRLVQAQAAQRHRSASTASSAARRAFERLHGDDWWNPEKTKTATKDALRVVQPAQRQAARSAASFLARAAKEMTGKTVRPAGAVDVTKLRKAMPAGVAKALAEGRLEPAFLVLGDLEDGPGDNIDTEVTLAVPDPNESVIERLRRLRAERETAAAEPLDPGEPYGRAADLFRREIAEGKTEDQARDKALLRVSVAAETDVTLAVREQWRASGKNIPGIRGYRRILHPEQSKDGPCGLCVVAADRIYRVAELLPLHDRCRCEVLPIIGELDPGIDLNAADLEAIYRAAGGTGGEKLITVGGRRKHVSPALKKIRVALAEHGELGPWLVDANQHWRGPRQVAQTKLRSAA
jgi:hypothetical protein